MMEKKSYIITLDEKSSFIGVTPAFGSRYDYVKVSKPVSVAFLDDNPKALAQLIQNSCKNQKLHTEEELEKARQDGQSEAWELARKIITAPIKGGYTNTDLKDIFGLDFETDYVSGCFEANSYREAADKVQKWEEGKVKTFHRFDIVKVRIDDHEEEAIVTRVDGNEVDLMCRGGRTTYRNISDVTKTGRTLEYGLLKWMKGEE
jgi:hypothetical protein